MSIADTIAAMANHTRQAYDSLSAVGGSIPEHKNIENIAEVLNNLYEDLPKNIDEGENLNLSTRKGKMEIDLKGNTGQTTIAAETGTNVNATSIYVSDVDTDKEHTIEMSGNTYQYTTTGKNLYGGGDNLTNQFSYLLPCETGKTYTLSFKAKGTSNERVFFRTYTDLEHTSYVESEVKRVSETMNSYSMTLTSSIDGYLFLATATGIGIYSFENIMVEIGSTPSTFEPYTNGASPNPSYPQNIEVVTGTNNIEVCGKNLANVSILNKVPSVVNGNLADYNGGGCTELIEINNAKEYILSFSQTNNDQKYVLFYDSNKNYLGYSLGMATNWLLSNNTNFNNSKYVRLRFDKLSTLTWCQLELGSTATTYEQYQGNIYPINLGKNLWNNTIYQRGGSTNRCDVAAFIVEPNTRYTFSTGTSNIQIMNYYQDIDKNSISNTNWVNTPYTYTTPNNCYYISMALRKGDDSSLAPNDIIEVQLEKGNQATSYSAYKTPIELCKINTYQDRIYKRNNKWYLEKNIVKAIYDGSNDENWTQMTQQGDYYRYGIKNTDIKNDSTLEKTILNYSNYFKAITFWDRNSNMNNTIYTICNNNVSNSAFYINTPNFTSINEFKTWLSTHNTTVYYVLSTPTTTEITDTTLVNQLNALYSATIYSTTNINTDTSNLLPYIDLHYNFVTPSPSPSRPSNISVVKGNNTIKVEGLNLFKDEYIGIPSVDNINAVLSAGTYTLSACDNTNFGTNIYVRLFDKNGNIITESGHMTATSGGSTINWNFSNSSYSYYGGSNFSTITFTIDNDYQLNIGLLSSSGTRKVMLVKGSEVVRTYTPYQNQTYPINIGDMELCKIGTYQDYIYESNGNWFKKGNIGKVVLDGSEGWVVSTDSYQAGVYNLNLNTTVDIAENNSLCNRYSIFNRYTNVPNSYGISSGYVRIRNENLLNSTDFKRWLSNNNVIIYYPLLTPTDTQITDTTLINQLNTILNAMSYDNQTNINQINIDKPFIISATTLE